MKSCKLVALINLNLLIEVYLVLKSGFQVIAFFILLKVGYLVTIVVRQLFSGHYKIMSDWFIFSEYFSDSWLNFNMITWLCYFSKLDAKTIAIKFKSGKYM